MQHNMPIKLLYDREHEEALQHHEHHSYPFPTIYKVRVII